MTTPIPSGCDTLRWRHDCHQAAAERAPGRGFPRLGWLPIVSLLGCASAPPPTPPPPPVQVAPEASPVALEFRNGPPWLRKCELAFPDVKNRPLCGVDGILDAKTPMLARTGAEAKARANLAKRVVTVVRSGLVSFQVKHRRETGGNQQQDVDEQYVEDTSKEITQMTLVGVKVHDVYQSPQGSTWVMVTMDKDSFRQQVQNLTQYDAGLRKEIIERAEDSFRELDDATDHRARPSLPKDQVPQ
jgi:hypothetical protein